MDPVSLVVGAAIAALGFLAGRRRGGRRKPGDPVGPVCDCGHSLALHNEDTRRCHAQTRLAAFDAKLRWGNGPCPCQRYVGPVPLESVWVPPITGRED